MKPRITISTSAAGELHIYLNEEGRDLLVRELLRLDKRNDHFHLGTYETAEIEMSDIAYGSTDVIIDAAKVLFRPDEWDRRYFPHVFGKND
jgi:hypothetical protein